MGFHHSRPAPAFIFTAARTPARPKAAGLPRIAAPFGSGTGGGGRIHLPRLAGASSRFTPACRGGRITFSRQNGLAGTVRGKSFPLGRGAGRAGTNAAGWREREAWPKWPGQRGTDRSGSYDEGRQSDLPPAGNRNTGQRGRTGAGQSGIGRQGGGRPRQPDPCHEHQGGARKRARPHKAATPDMSPRARRARTRNRPCVSPAAARLTERPNQRPRGHGKQGLQCPGKRAQFVAGFPLQRTRHR